MLHYVALLWDRAHAEQQTQAEHLARRIQAALPQWQCSFAAAGCKVFHSRSGRSLTSIPLHRQGGVVLGTVFERAPSPASIAVEKITFDERETTAILESGGRHLISNHWGRYVAFLCDVTRRHCHVLRDPTGRLPCFMTILGKIHVVFSSAEYAAKLADSPFSVNWKYIEVRAISSVAETRETALNEVSNILGGERVAFMGDEIRRDCYWSPASFVTPTLEDPQQAAARLRSTVKGCVHAWANSHDSVLAMLSGGLDSSIVVACLQGTPHRPRITCLTFHSAGASSDERVYARSAAQRAGVELVEIERDARVDLRAMRFSSQTAQPFHYPYKLEVGAAQSRVAASVGATAIFDGNGGDGVFYASPASPAVRDYVHDQGLRPGLLDVAMNIAKHEQASIWRILREALRDRSTSQPWDPLLPAYAYRRLVRPEIITAVRRERRFLHPWLQEARDMPPGKLWHLFYMSIPLNFDHQIGAADRCELILPLVSQPVLELLAQVPTYTLLTGGADRAVARLAFAPDLPSEVVNRQTKGFREEYLRQILDRNRTFVREMLLGGLLVEHGILDAPKVDDVLSGRPSKVGAAPNEIFSHLSNEVWLRYWTGQRAQAAA